MKFHFVFCATEGLKHFLGYKTKDGIKNKEGRKKRREDGREGGRVWQNITFKSLRFAFYPLFFQEQTMK